MYSFGAFLCVNDMSFLPSVWFMSPKNRLMTVKPYVTALIDWGKREMVGPADLAVEADTQNKVSCWWSPILADSPCLFSECRGILWDVSVYFEFTPRCH